MGVRLFLLVSGLMVLLSGGAAAQTDTLFLDRWHFIKQGIVGVYGLDGNFNPGRYKWSVLTPSQMHLPALPKYVDPNQIYPFPEASSSSGARNLSTLIYRNCPESDRCEFSFPQTEPQADKILFIRLAGIHAPHLKASCDQETFLGGQARDLIHEYLSSAVRIELRNFSQYGREIVGRLVVDGQDLSELLVGQGLAVQRDGNDKDWCL